MALAVGSILGGHAYIAGGLFLATSLGGQDPPGQVKGIKLLFGALLVVVVGSLLGEVLGVRQVLGRFWFWFGHQSWEYLDLGRAWQVLLAAGLFIWLQGNLPRSSLQLELSLGPLTLLC